MSWFEKLIPSRIRTEGGSKKAVPEGLWVKCDGCREIIYAKELERNLHVCPKCNYHFRISAPMRLESMFDEGEYELFDENVSPKDFLKFKDKKRYRDRLTAAPTRPTCARRSCDRPRQTRLAAQRPRRKARMATIVMTDSAIVMAQNTPAGPQPSFCARIHASGI